MEERRLMNYEKYLHIWDQYESYINHHFRQKNLLSYTNENQYKKSQEKKIKEMIATT